jgi:hypothetical protein
MFTEFQLKDLLIYFEQIVYHKMFEGMWGGMAESMTIPLEKQVVNMI